MDMDSLVGFRFKPTNEELITLLKKKRLDSDFSVQTIKEIDFYGFDPWELPRYSGIQSKESIWFFYCKPYYFKNSKTNRCRQTKKGYWKVTSQPSNIKAKNSEAVIGRKRILTFYLRGLISKEAKTEWIMHEIHVEDNPLYKEDFVICCLKRKRHNKLSISTSGEGESSQHLVATENTSPKSVLIPNQPLGNHDVAEKPFLFLSNNSKLRLLSNQCCDGHNALDNDSCSEPQSPLCLEQGSTFSNGPSNGCDLLNSYSDSEQVDDLINSQRAFQNNFSDEETGQALNPEFNASKLDGGVYVENGSELDTETFVAWVTKLFEN